MIQDIPGHNIKIWVAEQREKKIAVIENESRSKAYDTQLLDDFE